ncbi:alpha/beta-hydrolase [Periconia macrospinosa]|uniref:Alpha/beta-hydrolase n=1 Tax=Periconia macrospinosa TaxID=97972 RepID=A0A2V1DRS8_9PLEO|nr:alpha/beta-hydrolase [Periconia macrospinosa]
MQFTAFVIALGVFVGSTLAAPLLENVEDARNGRIEIVKRTGEDGEFKKGLLCESTEGVEEVRGYFAVGENIHLWFWYFSARSNSSTAPLVAWLNGGPGASSMIGLFQNNGPCHFPANSSSSSPTRNEQSFNNVANMLYIDQPAGAGFSYGTNDTEVNAINSTPRAVPYVYDFLQAFLAHGEFAHLAERKFGVATASYGGHYGPELVRYIQERNENGRGQTKINLAGLAINNGLFDYGIQHPAMADYLLEKKVLDEEKYAEVMADYESECAPALHTCEETDTDADCANADDKCYSAVEGPLGDLQEYVYDVRGMAFAPPTTYIEWLGKNVDAVGNRTEYRSSSNAIFNRFIGTGDTARSMIPLLSEFVQTNVPTLIWAGDQDVICNYIGVRKVAESVEYKGQAVFKQQDVKKWTVGGTEYGLFKTQDNLS